jgi:hypothetical protein
MMPKPAYWEQLGEEVTRAGRKNKHPQIFATHSPVGTDTEHRPLKKMSTIFD